MKRVVKISLIICLYLLINDLFFPKYILTPAYLYGNSNYPTNKYHTFILSGYPYNLSRGDFVMVDVGEQKKEKIIYKRIIGLPGDHVEMKDGVIYINGQQYNEDYIDNIDNKNETHYDENNLDFNFTFEYIMEQSELEGDIIPRHHYLILGDNRQTSVDSRYFGLVQYKQIKGKMVIKVAEFDNEPDTMLLKSAKKFIDFYERLSF